MNEQPEPLSNELRALIALERDAYEPDPELAASVHAHIERAVVLGQPGVAASATQRTAANVAVGAKKVMLIAIGSFLLGGGSGFAITRSATRSATRAAPEQPVAIVTLSVASTRASASTAITSAAQLTVTSDSSVTPVLSAPTSATVAPVTARGDLVREREMLDVARAALARGRPGDALAAGDELAKKWPRGYLVEEREVVMVQALVRAGRRDEAERRAAQFRKSFATSILLPAVDAALGTQ
jgi:hypothetical protein